MASAEIRVGKSVILAIEVGADLPSDYPTDSGNDDFGLYAARVALGRDAPIGTSRQVAARIGCVGYRLKSFDAEFENR